MRRSTPLIITMLVICAVSAFSQAAIRSDSQTLQAILAELRQLRHDLQTTNAMAARAQIALYRLQREDDAVARASQRVSDVRTKDIQQDKAVANRSDTSQNSQQEFEEIVLPRLKSELELLQKQEQQARAEQA